MLKQRIITAVILLALLLPAVAAASPWPFALLTLVMVTGAGWEWGRLNQAGSGGAIALGVLLALACGAAALGGWTADPPQAAWWTAALVWVVAGAFALRGGPEAWPRVPRALRLAIGLLVLWTGWLALAHAKTRGINFLLSAFCLVWAADVAAYFGGRAFGRRKLAPSISPGKSWEGVYSGIAGVLVLAVVWALVIDHHAGVDSVSLYGELAQRWGWGGMVVALLALTALSVVGDLFESLVKRAAGAKDSSELLPGHGGVLDRIDALLPMFPTALALA
jgi:phosphatidate cytidylyltransferase